MECRNWPEDTIVGHDVKIGESFVHGIRCIIEPDVVIGNGVYIGHNVILKSGTRIKDNVVIGDNCITTGLCIVGNNVIIRTGSVISRGVIINDWAFIGAGVMSSHTKNVYHGRPNMKKIQLVTNIGYGCVIGSRVNLVAGVDIVPGTIIGYAANVIEPIVGYGYGQTIWYGNPAIRHGVLPEHSDWLIDVPRDYTPYEFTKDDLEKYLQHVGIG